MGYFCQRPSDREPGLHVVLVRLPYSPPVQRHPALIERVIPKIERPRLDGSRGGTGRSSPTGYFAAALTVPRNSDMLTITKLGIGTAREYFQTEFANASNSYFSEQGVIQGRWTRQPGRRSRAFWSGH